jgi:septum formation protein
MDKKITLKESSYRLILASKSPRRKEILEALGLEFSIFTKEVEELNGLSNPVELVEKNSVLKAESLEGEFSFPAYVIGSDTVVVYQNEVLGKPTNKEEAFRMLSFLRNKTHQVISGLAIYDTERKKTIVGHSITEVKMWNFSDDFIEKYIATEEPLDKAGAYGIQGLGRLLVEKINGCYYNVVGLPVYLLQELFLTLGVTLL